MDLDDVILILNFKLYYLFTNYYSNRVVDLAFSRKMS